MHCTSSLLSLLVLAVNFSVNASASPNNVLVTHEIAPSRPYAPELKPRSEEDPIRIKRFPSTTGDDSSWSPFDILSKRSFSEEELHSRGKLDDSIFEKREWCWTDKECGGTYYGSEAKNYCYKKIEYNKSYSRDYACSSGYCSNLNKCRSKLTIGSKCHGRNDAFMTGYCSVKSDTCKSKASEGGKYLADSGCETSLICLNQKCTSRKGDSKPTTSTMPSGPSPSGSAQDKRMLRELLTGHKALYVTGAGTSASLLGRADLGFLAMQDLLHVAGMAARLGVAVSSNSQPLPVIADADTGFGGAPQVARTIEEYHRAGIAALHIEDQVATKRFGHLGSKQLVSTNDFLARISAATSSRDRLRGDAKDKIMIIARTDAVAVNGLEDAISRMIKAKEMGADMGFVQGLKNDQDVHTVISRLSSDGWPILANLVTGGVSPLWKAQDAQKLGFKLAIFPCAGLYPAMRALEHSYSHLLQHGIGAEAAEPSDSGRHVDLYQRSKKSGQVAEDKMTLKQFFTNVSLELEAEIDAKAALASKSKSALGQL